MADYTILELVEASADGAGVRGFVHRPEPANGDALVLTHGAGANCQSPLLVALARSFCEAGFTVLRFDLPFRQQRPHGPPVRGSSERDQLGVLRAIGVIKKIVAGRVFAGGHSYGGRQVTMLAAEDPSVAEGLLLLSYPLHPPNRPEQMRTAHFPALSTSALFFHGTRDGFGTLEEVRAALNLITAPTKLVDVPGAGHELFSKRNAKDLPQLVVREFLTMFGHHSSR